MGDDTRVDQGYTCGAEPQHRRGTHGACVGRARTFSAPRSPPRAGSAGSRLGALEVFSPSAPLRAPPAPALSRWTTARCPLAQALRATGARS